MTVIMNDREWGKLLKTIDTEAASPKGLKEKILVKVMISVCKSGPVLTPFERFFFEKPLRTACFIAIPVSGFLWAILGSGFGPLLNGIIG